MNSLESLRPFLSQPPIKEESGKWYFRKADKTKETTDSFDRIKILLKKFPRTYYAIIKVLSPVWCWEAPQKRFFAQAKGTVLNIGSGNQPRFPKTVNLDMMDYENVDIVCDIHALPFQNSSIQGVFNCAVLEHVKNPQVVVQEAQRVLAPGGLIFSVIPFMQPFHASPHDYQRFTFAGIAHLHGQFEQLDCGVFSGPASGFLWVFQEFVATVLSFGSPTIRNLLTIILMLVTWPLKYLDFLLVRLPTAKNVASSFYFFGRKK